MRSAALCLAAQPEAPEPPGATGSKLGTRTTRNVAAIEAIESIGRELGRSEIEKLDEDPRG